MTHTLTQRHTTMCADVKAEAGADTDTGGVSGQKGPATTGVAVWCTPETSGVKCALKLVVCVLTGMLFGLAIEKGRVFEPHAIRNQMVFSQFTMLKMFLAAMCTGQLVFAIMSVSPLRSSLDDALSAFVSGLKLKGLTASILGPFILGTGMTLAGACPGTVLVQVGAGTSNAAITLAAGLTMALLYGLVGHKLTTTRNPKSPFTYSRLPEHTGYSFWWFAFPMAFILALAVFLLEYFIPWHADLPAMSRNPINGTTTIFSMKAWPPYVSGIIVGLLQFVIVALLKDSLGSSSAYMTIVSQWVISPRLQSAFPYLAKARIGIGNYWQLFYITGAIGGSVFSSLMSNTTGTTWGVAWPWALAGGILILLGSRIGGGCTSGHGLSGTALLFYQSWIAMPFMFVGGITSAFTMRWLGFLDQYVCPYNGDCPKGFA